MTDTRTAVPTLTSTDDAHALLRQLAGTHDWVSVFWDRGWGDSGQIAEISIIVDGNGQHPKAFITPDAYRELCDQEIVEPNSLKTFKARRIHDYKTPPPPPKPAVNPADIAEGVFRSILAEIADQPIRVEFFRGLDPNSRTPRIMQEIVDTPACGHAEFVLILPGAAEAAISAQGPYEPFLGPGIVGRAAVVRYPTTAGGDVDTDALAGDEFRAELVRVIGDKLAAALASVDR